MSDQPDQKTPLDKDIENVAVVDPDDYAKTRKIKQIEDAKENVLEVRKQKNKDIVRLAQDRQEPGAVIVYNKIATAVADYGREIQPYADKALQKGIITEEDTTIKLEDFRHSEEVAAKEIDLFRWVRNDGKIETLTLTWETTKSRRENFPFPPESISMAVFDRINLIKMKIGLGPALEEQRTPAEI